MDVRPVDVPETERTRRLHPLTFLQRFIVSLPGVVLLLLPLLQGGTRDAWLSIGFAIFYGFIAIPLMFLQYFRFRYTITPREIIIQSGVLTRRNRSIPVERVQNIEIIQTLLPRLFGAAKVKIETAGSGKTEGVLELVSIQEAQEIRRLIRAYQRAAPTPVGAPAGPPGAAEIAEHVHEADTGEHEELLLELPFGRVLLSGVFRFSLLYIALIFSGLQYVDNDPDAVARWLERGPLRPLADFAAASPWTAGILFLTAAALLSWITGILVNINRYYNFRLSLETGKLHVRHGLLTVSERTIPLKRVQAVVLRSNPMMRHFGWWRLEVQTMGIDQEQQGYQVVAPFVQWDEAQVFAQHIRKFDFPSAFSPVSRLAIRRAFIRYGLIVAAVASAVGYFWRPGLWLFALLPAAFWFALLHYRNHGYATEGAYLFVRRGVIRHYIWMIPAQRFQVFYNSASLFQRRLGLKTLFVDTAGGRTLLQPEITDLPAGEADAQLGALYRRFQASRAVR